MNQAARPNGLAAWLRQRTRHVWNRPTLSFAALVFLLVFLAFAGRLNPARDLLLAFNVASAAFIVLTIRMMSRSTLASMRERAGQQREGRWVVLGVSLVVSLATLVAVSVELHSKSGGPTLQVLLSVSALVLAWLFVNTTFALHYAHAYHDKQNPKLAGLLFPGGEEPDYWDFMYFAFVLGMTFQVSDVQITNPAVRRFALLHGVLAFFFNVVIIALTVNLIAGLG